MQNKNNMRNNNTTTAMRKATAADFKKGAKLYTTEGWNLHITGQAHNETTWNTREGAAVHTSAAARYRVEA